MTDAIFIFGQQWVPQAYYDKYYAPAVAAAFADTDAEFIVGAADGVDTFAQRQLATLADATNAHARVTIFNKGAKDGRLHAHFKLSNGYTSYPERDAAAFEASTHRIRTLAQVGGGASGCMLMVLLELFEGVDVDSRLDVATDALAFIREATEPYSPEFFARMRDEYARE